MAAHVDKLPSEIDDLEIELPGHIVAEKNMPCKQLPAEIWSQIFTFTEAFTLWTDCRRVSIFFRSEAEKVFTKIYLPQLRIQWAYEGRIMQCEHAAMISYAGRAYLGDFIRLDGSDCGRAHFKLQVHRDVRYTPPLPSPDPALDEHYVGHMFPKMMAYRDVDYPLRFGNMVEPTIAQAAWLGGHFNDVEMPNIEYDTQGEEVILEWKTFFNHFYGDYAFVRRSCGFDVVHAAEYYLQQKTNPREDIHASKIDHWIQNFGDSENGLFWKAYLQRLERSHEKMGEKLFDDKVDTKLAQNILSRVAQTQKERNRLIIGEFMQKRGLRRIEDAYAKGKGQNCNLLG